MRDTRLGCEVKRLLDSHSGEVIIVFGAVLDVPAVMFANLFWSERVIVDVSFNGVVFASVVGEDFEKGGATRSRPAEDD